MENFRTRPLGCHVCRNSSIEKLSQNVLELPYYSSGKSKQIGLYTYQFCSVRIDVKYTCSRFLYELQSAMNNYFPVCVYKEITLTISR